MAQRGLAGNPWNHQIPTRYHGRGHGITWCHSWNTWYTPKDGVERVPMLWGLDRYMPDGKYMDYLDNALQQIPTSYSGWFIFVNEPTLTGQSNLTPNTAAWLFRVACEHWPNAKFTSPQVTIWHPHRSDQWEIAQNWLGAWWHNIGYHNLQHRVRAWAWHNYDPDPAQHILRTQRWGGWVMGQVKPLEGWVTEWACGGEQNNYWVSSWLDQWDKPPRLFHQLGRS
jgi:hypothetical protein